MPQVIAVHTFKKAVILSGYSLGVQAEGNIAKDLLHPEIFFEKFLYLQELFRCDSFISKMHYGNRSG